MHGGAGVWQSKKHGQARRGTEAAARAGYDVLANRGTARDAVEAAIVVLEDDPCFNAGTGSTMNLEGRIENDAAIMDGRKLESGAVALVNGIRNPIRLARLVMEKTDHVLLAGRTAERLGRVYKLAAAKPILPERFARWNREKNAMERGRPNYFPRNRVLEKNGLLAALADTVGALAIDQYGNLAAASSTGGVTLKLPGRIGDSALVGAGLYADDKLGAATATGIGELAIRTSVSKTACDLMRSYTAQAASEKAIRIGRNRVGKGLGIITLDRRGEVGVSHTTRHLAWACADKKGTKSGMKGTTI